MADTVNATLTASGDQVIQLLMEMNAHLKAAAEGAKDVSENAEKAGKELTDAAKDGSTYWTELNSKMSVIGGVLSTAWEYAQKFHEIQMKGRKENLQWESMMNSTRADEIQKNLGKINESFGDNVDKTTKWRMAYASAFSDVKYDMDAFSNIAQNMAQRTGKDLNEMIEELQQGLLKGDLGILEDNGILHNANLEMQKFAGSIGKTVDELSDFEKRQGQANIVMRYLNTEFNNSKPLHDDYIATTNKLSRVTEDFASDVSRLTDEFIALNTEAGNLSIKKQMEKVAQDIQDAKKIISDGKAPYTTSFGADDFYGVGVIDDVGSDLAVKNAKEGMIKHESKFLTLMNNQSRILSGKLLSDYKIRGVETVAEMKEIQKNIDIAIEKAEIGLDKYSGSNEDLFSEQGRAAYVNLQALKNVRAETVKELELIKGIKTKKTTGKAAAIKDDWEEVYNATVDEQRKLTELEQKNTDDEYRKKVDAIRAKTELLKAGYEIEKDIATQQSEWKKKLAEFDKKEAEKIEKAKVKTFLNEEFKLQDEKDRLQKMGLQKSAQITSMLINDVLLGEKEFRKEMIGDFVKGIGDQMVADGTFHIFAGIAKGWSGNPAGWVQAKAGAAEVGAGIAMGATAKAIGTTSSESESKSKETAAADRNSTKGDPKQKMDVYLYPDEKRWLRSLNKSNNKLGVQRGR